MTTATLPSTRQYHWRIAVCSECGQSYTTRGNASKRCRDCQRKQYHEHKSAEPVEVGECTSRCKHYDKCKALVGEYRDPMCFTTPGAD